MNYEILKITEENGIMLLTISRPKAMNALNTQFFKEMNALLDTVENRADLSVLIITGEGKAFVAGADIAEMVSKNTDEGTEFSRLGQRTLRRLEYLSIPVIAAVNGFALGGGCELAMACDFRLANNFAKFGQPEVNLGLIPGYAGTQRLSRLVGLADSLYMQLTADMVGAEDALRIGLVQKVFSAETFMEEVMKIASTIAKKGPVAVKKVKAVTRQGIGMDFDEACALEAVEFGSLFGAGTEAEEGMKAFIEKRKPNW